MFYYPEHSSKLHPWGWNLMMTKVSTLVWAQVNSNDISWEPLEPLTMAWLGWCRWLVVVGSLEAVISGFSSWWVLVVTNLMPIVAVDVYHKSTWEYRNCLFSQSHLVLSISSFGLKSTPMIFLESHQSLWLLLYCMVSLVGYWRFPGSCRWQAFVMVSFGCDKFDADCCRRSVQISIK
jgi:hypothetical protein